jgi:tetratricopeptide (TPR) repeat protein
MAAIEADKSALPAMIGERYRVVRLVGRGGMALVYEAVDEATGKHLAVKQFSPRHGVGDGQMARLFASEFHTLTQLAHPRVVAVYDYQTAPEGAFYTMELLDGGDLREEKALPWQVVCALLCDVCSALSLLHSRRFVHRDVTPRNVRRTRDGKAKLIDFGAMVPFGTHKRAVGTPAFTAPEVVMGQPLDGRADLYSVGATAYYALTGRPPYRARTFEDLRNAWRSRPGLPSHYAPDVPPDLDQLIMSLLNLQPARRPANAGAAIERLTAIAGLKLDEQVQVQRSYLSTPSLVDRDGILQHVRRLMIQAARGYGTSIFLTGPHGVGLSRMVDACALEGKLASAVVLRVDASDAQDGDWGGVRSLLEQLVTELPSKAVELLLDRAEVLAHIWPRATELTGISPRPFSDPKEIRSAVQQNLLKLTDDVIRHFCLVVTADDIDQLDEPTRAFIALLAQQVQGRRLVVVTAASSDAISAGISGLQLLRREESTITLAPLSSSGTERLLISVFGEVPNVHLLANRLHDTSLGLPATTMQLAQHLLDKNAIRFADGGWLLPTTVDSAALPTAASDMMRARIAHLDETSITLAQTIALSQKATVTIEECGELLGQSDLAEVLGHLDQLVIRQVLRQAGDRYALGQPTWAPLLVADIDPERKRQLHAKVARLLMRTPGATNSAAGHFLAAGDPKSAIACLLLDRKRLDDELAKDPSRTPMIAKLLSSDWRATMEAVLVAAERLGRPRSERLALQLVFSYYLSITAQSSPELIRDVVRQLASDSGLNDYRELGDIVAPEQRLGRALERAQQRYDATPEAERGLPPGEAIPALVRVYLQIIGMIGASLDLAFFQELPSLEPLVPLSPTIALVHLNVRSTSSILMGQYEQALEGFLEILARMRQPAGVGLVPAMHRYVELSIIYAATIIEIGTGLPEAADRVDFLEGDVLFEVKAQRLRMLLALQRGDVEMADDYLRKFELLKIRNSTSQFFEGSELWGETLAYIEIGDVARLRQSFDPLNAMAAKFRYWGVVPMLVQGHILRLRGEPAAALEVFCQAFEKLKGSPTLAWATVARAYLMALAECGRVTDARVSGTLILAEANAAGLTVQVAGLHYAMAAVELAGSDYEAALAHLQSVEDVRSQWPLSSVFGGACHELRARIAIARREQEAFEAAADQCGKAFLVSRNPVLVTRHQRLMQDAERAHLRIPPTSTQAPPLYVAETVTMTIDATTATMENNRTLLAGCHTFEERIAAVLALATGQAIAKDAMLYLVRDQVLKLTVQRGNCPDVKRINPLVTEFLNSELEENVRTAINPDDLVTITVDTADWVGPTGAQFAPALLSHRVAGGLAITGVLVFDVDAQRRPSDALLSQLSEALTVSKDVEPIIAKPRAKNSMKA